MERRCGCNATCTPPIHYIQSDVEFDAFQLTANPNNPGANWVLASLHLPESTMVEIVPTMGEWGLISLGMLLMIFGVVAVGQRKTAIA